MTKNELMFLAKMVRLIIFELRERALLESISVNSYPSLLKL